MGYTLFDSLPTSDTATSEDFEIVKWHNRWVVIPAQAVVRHIDALKAGA